MQRKQFLRTFEKFILPYKTSRASYGILLIFNKTIIVFLKEMVIQMTISGEMIVILLIMLFYLMIYFSIQRLSKPYKAEKYEILDLIEKRLIILHISNTLMALIWISTLEDKNKSVGWLIFIYVLLTNLVFLTWWFHNYFAYLKKKLARFSAVLKKKFNFKANRSIQVPIKSQTLKKKKDTETNDDYLIDKVNKLKLLNALLIERIRELELDLPHENSIAGEEYFIKPRITKYESEFQRIIDDEIGSEEKHPNFIDKIKGIQISSNHATLQSDLTQRKRISLGNETFRSINRSSRIKSDIGQIDISPIIKHNDSKVSIQEAENNLLFLEKSLVGRRFYKTFLLLKYKILNERFTLIKNSLILSKCFYFFLSILIFELNQLEFISI